MELSSESLSGMHQQVFENRSKAQRREKSQCANDEDHPTSNTVNSGVVTGKVPSEGGTILFLREIAGDCQHRDDHQEAAHRASRMQASGCTMCVFAFSPAKAEPLFPVAEVKA